MPSSEVTLPHTPAGPCVEPPGVLGVDGSPVDAGPLALSYSTPAAAAAFSTPSATAAFSTPSATAASLRCVCGGKLQRLDGRSRCLQLFAAQLPQLPPEQLAHLVDAQLAAVRVLTLTRTRTLARTLAPSLTLTLARIRTLTLI